MWMFPLAIACGNTFVLKPSEKDPSAANLLAELAAEAGLPDGVLNVLHGDKVAVDGLLHHPDVAAVSFVGSTPIARYIHATASRQRQACAGARRRQEPHAGPARRRPRCRRRRRGLRRVRLRGERCMAISAVVVVGSVADELVGKIRDRAEQIKIGPGSDPSSEMGPLITAAHRDKVATYVTGAAAQGAEGRPGRHRLHGRGPRGRPLDRPLAARPRIDGLRRLPGRDLRPGPLRPAGRHLRGRRGPDERLAVR